jgi:hypothetical protein
VRKGVTFLSGGEGRHDGVGGVSSFEGKGEAKSEVLQAKEGRSQADKGLRDDGSVAGGDACDPPHRLAVVGVEEAESLALAERRGNREGEGEEGTTVVELGRTKER